MADFPLLNTGAITQYPLGIFAAQESSVIRFIDGADQRYRNHARMLRRWEIHLDLLNESEVAALESFFTAQIGAYSTFSFPDPYGGPDIPNCRFAADAMLSEYQAVNSSATSFWVIETNG